MLWDPLLRFSKNLRVQYKTAVWESENKIRQTPIVHFFGILLKFSLISVHSVLNIQGVPEKKVYFLDFNQIDPDNFMIWRFYS